MKAYKLLRKKKDGKLYPLFINKTIPTPIGEWMQAECYPTKGFAIRKGWHCCFEKNAPHLKMKLSLAEVALTTLSVLASEYSSSFEHLYIPLSLRFVIKLS